MPNAASEGMWKEGPLRASEVLYTFESIPGYVQGTIELPGSADHLERGRAILVRVIAISHERIGWLPEVSGMDDWIGEVNLYCKRTFPLWNYLVFSLQCFLERS